MQTGKIGYLGPPGTYSEIAARRYREGFGESSGKMELVPLSSLEEIFSGVEGGRLDEGVIPLENSTEGSVNQTMDLLAHRFHGVKIRGEVILPVFLNLLARPGVSLGEISCVLSHPQAVAQCRLFLGRFLPAAELRETASTAEAAALVAASPAPWAAVGTAAVARTYGLAVLAERINDCPDNATRFIVIGREEAPPGPGCKTSLLFSVEDRPGTLYAVLAEFAKRNINLTRIESRPKKNRLGEYLFFLDFAGHRLEKPAGEALAAVSGLVVDLRVLGSYPAAGTPSTAAGPAAPSRAVPSCLQLRQVREEIDRVDEQIVRLLGRRTRLAKKIGGLKKGARLRDRTREEEIIRRVRRIAAEEGLDESFVVRIYRQLFTYCVALQESARC
jgi:prephenate dehydratase